MNDAAIEAARLSNQEPASRRTESSSKRTRFDEALTLMRLTLPDWPLLIGAFTCLTIAAAGEAILPDLQGTALNAALAIDGSNRVGLRAALYKLGVVGAVTATFTGIRGFLFWMCGARLVVRLRSRLFETLLRQPQAFHDEQGPGEMSTRLAADCVLLGDALSMNVNIVLRQVMQSILSIAFVFRINARLAGLVLAGVALRSVFSHFYANAYRRVAKAQQDALAVSSGVAEQCMSLIKIVRSHGNEHYEGQRYRQKMNHILELERRQATLYGSSRILMGALDILVLTSVIGLGGTLIAMGLLPAEKLTSFVLYVTFISGASSEVVDNWSEIQEALGAATKVFDYLVLRPLDTSANATSVAATSMDTMPPKSLRPTTSPLLEQNSSAADKRGSLTFEAVNFSYPSQPTSQVLEQLSLSVHAGERLAIVGGSGSGKSTIFALALRFYQPNGGKVMLDGVPLDVIDEPLLRSSIAWVQQEPPLFPNVTIRENIAYGLPEASLSEVESAAKEANAYDFIQKLPNGFETRIAAAGSSLSGGQKQRIALARALVRNPDLLLLDEATSALDPESERLVEAAIRRASKRHTVIFATHKVAQARHADRIIVMSQGRIVEEGTHNELLECDGAYAELLRAGNSVSEEEAAALVAQASGCVTLEDR